MMRIRTKNSHFSEAAIAGAFFHVAAKSLAKAKLVVSEIDAKAARNIGLLLRYVEEGLQTAADAERAQDDQLLATHRLFRPDILAALAGIIFEDVQFPRAPEAEFCGSVLVLSESILEAVIDGESTKTEAIKLEQLIYMRLFFCGFRSACVKKRACAMDETERPGLFEVSDYLIAVLDVHLTTRRAEIERKVIAHG